MSFRQVLGTEFLKLRRSPVIGLSFAVYSFMAAVAGLFMWMTLHPDSAQNLGLLGQKASFALGGMAADWQTFLFLIREMAGLGGLILVSIIMTFVFGREYAEGTAKNLLALPIPRSWFVAAKLLVATAWFAALSFYLLPAAVLAGSLAGLPGFDWSLFLPALGRMLGLAAMALACATLVAWVAVASRGYFAAMGFTIFTMILGSVFGRTGWAPWVPWCIVGIASGAAGPGIDLSGGSYAVLALGFIVGTVLTIRHEIRADNLQ